MENEAFEVINNAYKLVWVFVFITTLCVKFRDSILIFARIENINFHYSVKSTIQSSEPDEMGIVIIQDEAGKM